MPVCNGPDKGEPGNITLRESGQTSTGSFITREFE